MAKTMTYRECVAEKTRGKGGSQASVQKRLGKAAQECARKHGSK